MKVVIAGGQGFLGRALSLRLAREGHQILLLSRRAGPGPGKGIKVAEWTPDGTAGAWAAAIDGTDVVINLAGAGIADQRWTAARKREIRESRVLATRSLVHAVRQAAAKPAIFIQGSAIGYYGAFDDSPELDESSPPGSDLLGEICVAWEAEAAPVTGLGCRLVCVRTGIVLSREGGALKEMMRPFRFFVGGPMGSGRQHMSWIHLDDWIGMVAWAIRTPEVAGPLNATAPTPVANWIFCRALGRAMRRPSWLPVPGFALRLIVGEFANDGLLRGQRVLPRRADTLGFAFRYPRIEEAMRAAVQKHR